MQTPGRLGSAQPMPQLIMPARNQRLSSLLWTTRGPPESPWGENTLVKLTSQLVILRHYVLFCTWRESRPPSSLPAHIKMSGITWMINVTNKTKIQEKIKLHFLTSCLPAAKNMFLHFSFDTIGTLTWKYFPFWGFKYSLLDLTHVLENWRQNSPFTEAAPASHCAKLSYRIMSWKHQSFAYK